MDHHITLLCHELVQFVLQLRKSSNLTLGLNIAHLRCNAADADIRTAVRNKSLHVYPTRGSGGPCLFDGTPFGGCDK